MNVLGNHIDAIDLLKDTDFGEGLDEFASLLAELRVRYLAWPQEVPFVEWVFRNISLVAQESSRSGPMKLSVYQREIGNNVFHNPECRQVTVLKGVQIGYSKLLRVIYAYGVVVLAKRVAIAFPVRDDMDRFLKDEIMTLYERVKPVGDLVRPFKRGQAADTSNEHRYTNGAQGFFRSAYNEDDLQGFTSWLMIIDEADRSGWQPRGATAGDKVSQFRNRGTDFFDSVVIIGSTPGVREFSIVWREWETSDKRKLRVRCPHCGTEQELRWGSDKTRFGFKWKLDENGHVEEAWYQCDSDRKCKIDEDNDKEAMIEAGVYVPTAIPTRPGNVGIHAPSWISMSPGARWKILAQQWLEAQRAKAEGNLEPLKEFVTFKMAEPWDDLQSSTLDAQTVHDLQRKYPAEVPDDVIFLTAGIDMQSNKEGSAHEIIASREITIVGWNKRLMPRVIGHWIVPGEPGEKNADDAVRALLRRKFLRADGKEKRVIAAAHDLGGHHGDAVKAFCRSFPAAENVWAIKGKNITKGKRDGLVFPRRPSRSRKGGVPFYSVDTGLAKDAVARKLLVVGPGAAMFPVSMAPGYFDRLMCEEPRKQKNGGYWWDAKRGMRSHEEWDCLVYSYVAVTGLQNRFADFANLNLAASKDGIPDEPHDPETGELLGVLPYDGDDRSAQAATAGSQDVVLTRRMPTFAPRGDAEPRSRPEVSTETPDPGGAKRRRVKAKGGVVAVNRWGKGW